VVVAHVSDRSEQLDGGPAVDVVLLDWPGDADARDRLRRIGRPRLLAVPAGEPAPHVVDLDEDWIRLPASDGDVRARMVALAERVARSTTPGVVVRDGRLVHAGQWVALSPIEEQLLAGLVDDFGQVVSLERLTQRVAGRPLTPNAVRVHVMRVRRRILPLGVVVRTVHGRGYLVELAA